MVYQVPREQLFVAPKIQGLLVLRTLLYWVACLVLTSLALLGWRMFSDPSRPVIEHWRELGAYLGPAFGAALILLPVVIVDVVCLSNKLFGPAARLRASLRHLGTDHRVMPLHFRQNDFWHDFAVDFNQLVERLEPSERSKASSIILSRRHGVTEDGTET